MKKKSILLLPLILFGMVLAGCHGKKSSDNSGGNSDTPVNPQPSDGDGGEGDGGEGSGSDTVAVTSVAVSPSMLSLYVGDSDTLRATVLPENATDSTVTWASDHTDIATVADGVVTGVAAGVAKITATADGVSGFCTVTVSAQTTPPEPGPGPQPPEPVQSPYGVKIGTGEVQNVPANAEFVPSGNHAGAYKLEGLTVHAGDSLSFYNETVAIAENLGPNNDGEGNYNNYCGSLADGFTVQADATNATLYLDYYEPETAEGHDWLGFFLTGGTSGDHGNGGGSQTQAAGVVHYGQGTEWDDADMESYNESGYEELRVLELNLAENTEFAIHVGDGDDWRHFGDGKNEAAIESHDIVDGEGADHNFKVANAGKYDIYVKVEKGQDEKTVYIARKGDYVPAEHTYGLVGEYGSYNWDHDDEMVVNGAKTEASIENVALSTGDLIKVRLDGKWTHAYGWNDLTVKPEGAFKDGGEPDHNIEVVLDGIYDIKFVIETHKIEITAHAAPVTPVSLECEYKGGEVEVGHALEEDKVFVYVKYSDNSLGTENVASEAHYFADSVEVQTDQIFTAAGSYEITVKYTVDEQELQGTMTVVVVDALVDLNGITPSPTETTLKVGETQQISLTFDPENASDKNVEYVSDHTDIATVSESGLITAVAVGNATISINGAQGVTATVDVTVEAAAVPLAAHTLRNFTADVNTALTYNESESEYYVIGLEFAKNDVFKIKMSEDDSDWRGISALKEGGASANFLDDESEDHNLKCNVAGKYNIYVKVTPTEGKSIWIEEFVDRTGWKAVLKGEDCAVANSEDNLKQIEIKNVVMAIGDTIIFQNADGSVKQGYDQLKEACTAGPANFEKGTNGELKATVAGTYDFYIEITEAKGIWVVKHAVVPENTVKVSFSINYGTEYGQSVYIVGDFSSWGLTGAYELSWSEGNNWVGEFDIEVGTTLSYKFVIVKDGAIVRWEADPNRSLTVTEAVAVNATWQA